jgi:large subunit ribosomal protein L21
MYAIIEESGSQRKVTQGDQILVDLLSEGNAKPGDPIHFERVLVVGDIGGDAKLGHPYVAGASVTAEVVEPLVKGEKLDIWHFREKKAWQRKQGHRQRYTLLKVTAIKA